MYATFTVVLVMLPLFFLAGVEGRLLQPLGLAYLIALLASLFVALSLTPVLCSYLLPQVSSILSGREPALAAAVRRRYARWLPHVLGHPRLVIGAATVLFVAALATTPRMGRRLPAPLQRRGAGQSAR